MALVAVEAVTSHLVQDAELQDAVKVIGGADLLERWAKKEPTLLVSAHFGSWELFSEVMARRGVPLVAVVRPLKGAFNAHVIRSRLKAGVELIPPRGALVAILKALTRGRSVVQLIDQVVPAEHGVFVPFFGRPACTTPALSAAAIRSGAPVYVLMAARVGDHLEMQVDGPIVPPKTGDFRADLAAHTAMVTAVIEREIRKRPDQWLWLHRRWKVQPPAELQMATRSPTPNEPAG
jgi:Kdo2-lipid IVA lauroyltransferase/acyltransferase